MRDCTGLRHVARLAAPATGCLVKMRIPVTGAHFAGTMYDEVHCHRRRERSPSTRPASGAPLMSRPEDCL